MTRAVLRFVRSKHHGADDGLAGHFYQYLERRHVASGLPLDEIFAHFVAAEDA